MHKTKPFITDKKDFKISKKKLETICLTNEVLPNNVFLEQYKYRSFQEFDLTMSDEFWNILKNIANLAGDEFIEISVLDPAPESYFYKEFKYYNWAKLPVAFSTEDYWEFLNNHPHGSPADAIIYNSEKVVWRSPSGTWIIWGERSLETCIFASHTIDLSQSASWHDINWVLQESLPPLFKKDSHHKELIKLFKKNYG